MAAPRRSACAVWATVDDICSPCDDYDFPTSLLEDSLVVASDVLFELSGRQFPGSCSDTVRPCARRTPDDSFPNREVIAYGWTPYYYPWSGCGCNSSSRCSCAGLSQLTLGAYPITSITEVKVDGVVLDPSAYDVHDYRYLVRIDGENWPCCQDLTLDSDQDNTFEVSFTYGTLPPSPGVRAATDLACQLALSCSPETVGECTLPQRVTSITRQGVTMVVLDPFDFLEDGRTGVYTVDLFLKTYNPNGLRRPAQVISPDIGKRVRRVTT